MIKINVVPQVYKSFGRFSPILSHLSFINKSSLNHIQSVNSENSLTCFVLRRNNQLNGCFNVCVNPKWCSDLFKHSRSIGLLNYLNKNQAMKLWRKFCQRSTNWKLTISFWVDYLLKIHRGFNLAKLTKQGSGNENNHSLVVMALNLQRFFVCKPVYELFRV